MKNPFRKRTLIRKIDCTFIEAEADDPLEFEAYCRDITIIERVFQPAVGRTKPAGWYVLYSWMGEDEGGA